MKNKTRRKVVGETSDPDAATASGVAIVGVGAVGSSLARSLFRSGYRVLGLINRTLERAEEVAAQTGAQLASTDPADIPHDVTLIFICTADDSIAEAVTSLARSGVDFRKTVVAHVSGRKTSAALNPLRARGAQTLSFHPLGSFPPGNLNKTFQGLTIGLEGDALAVAVGRALALDLGAFPVEIPADAKPAYHLAAVLTSNHLVALMSDVETILATASLPAKLTHSLARDTLDNLLASSPEQALTGPLVRGDHEAFSSQIDLVGDVAPDFLSRFLTLADAVITIAERSGRIQEDRCTKLRRILEDAMGR